MPEASGVINTYSELLTAITDTLLRPDLAHEAPRWVQQTELELVRDCDVRAADQTKTGNFTASATSLTLPAGLIEIRSLQVTRAANDLRYMEVAAPDRIIARREQDSSGVPSLFYVHGDTIEFAPAAHATDTIPYVLKYYGLPEPLSNYNQSNLLLEMGSDALMYGALRHGAIRIADPDRTALYAQTFASAKESLRRAYFRSRMTGPLQQRPDSNIDDRHAGY